MTEISPSRLIHGFRTRRNISTVTQSTDIRNLNPRLTDIELRDGVRLGIDSHADTTCVNKHAYVEHVFEGFTVDAIPFDENLGIVPSLPIVNAIYAVDNLATYDTHLIRLNHSIYIKDMPNALLCPNQARSYGTIIDDVPPHLDHTGRTTFSMVTNDIEFPFSIFGPTAYVHVRRPTSQELESLDPIDITDPDQWEPYGSTPDVAHIAQVETTPPEGISHDQFEHPLDDLLLNNIHRNICGLMTTKPKDTLTPEYLCKIWRCGLKTAEKTIEASTCRHYRSTERGITRRFRPARSMLRYRILTLPAGEFFTDTMFAKIKSIRGYTCAQIYGNKYDFIKPMCMETHRKNEVGDTLQLLVQEVGVPQKIHCDNAPEMIGRSTPFFKRARKEGIDLTSLEPNRHNENYGELLVKKAKSMTARLMHRRNVPLRLWCYTLEYACQLHCLLVPGMYRNRGRSGYEVVLGHTPDISEYVEFQFYDYCWYWNSPQSFPLEKAQLGRWLGIALKVGQAMVFYVMGNNGKVVARSTVSPLSPDEINSLEVKQRMTDLDRTIKSKIGDYRRAPVDPRAPSPDIPDDDLIQQLEYCFDIPAGYVYEHDQQAYSNDEIPEFDDSPTDDIESEAFDSYLGLHVEIPSSDGESMVLAKVKERKRTSDGDLVGTYNENPILNTAVYKLESPDGTLHEYTANRISECIYDQVDEQGFNYDLMHEIINHRKDPSAISIEQGYYDNSNGTKQRKITTKGWQFQIQWENNETSWIDLKTIKESNPLDVADYAIKHNIHKEPAFAWWVPTVIRRRETIISKTSRRVRRRMKFGIQIPDDYDEAVKLDRANGNTLWQDSTKKEMKNVQIAFKFLDDGTKVPIGFKRITCHIIYDVKFTLDRKARYVAGGHLTNCSPSMSYSSVVSRDSVRILFLIAALNDLNIKMCDIGNAYLQSETREKYWFEAGKEWGSRAGQKVIITRALYGLKASGAEWKKTFQSYIRHVLGAEPCIGADDNVYRREETKPDGTKYYSYIAVYVDDVIVLHLDPDVFMNQISRDYRLKNPPEAPTMYLGADTEPYECTSPDGISLSCWALSSNSHLKKALEMIETAMQRDKLQYKCSKKTRETPFTSASYRPELDISDHCNDDQVQFYQSLIGILQWLCELGRIDILTEVSLLSSHTVSPRLGHMHQALHIFRYLKDHNRSRLVLDPSYVYVNDDHLPLEERAITRAKWMQELYPDTTPFKPSNAPKPLGRPVQISCFVDADHAGCRLTRRSRTGVLIYLNRAPILWYSKRQNTVETSTYGSEFVAMKQAMEMIKALKYKLHMFGIPILENETKVYGDNNAVILNSSIPESTLKKKHHSVNYHFVRECVASGLALIYKVDTGQNLADLFTKILDKVKRKQIISTILR